MSREQKDCGLVPADQLGSGAATSDTFLRGDRQWTVPPAGGSPPTGTGFRHITDGVEDAAAKRIDTADVNNDQITFATMQNLSGSTRFVGRFSPSIGDPEDLSGASATQMLSQFTSSTQGVVAGSGGGTTNFLRADGEWVAPGGGSDPWTFLRVTGVSFTTTSATAVDVTGLSFTPVANTTYEFLSVLRIQTVTTTVNPRVGLAWPTGMSDGVAMIEEAQAVNTVPIVANGNIGASLLIAVGGLPAVNASQMVRIQGMVEAGASPGSSLRVQLASETAGTAVRIMRGSFLRYRIA